MKWFLFIVLFIALFLAPVIYADTTSVDQKIDTSATGSGINIPDNFDFWYIGLFAFGMIIHYGVVVKNRIGLNNYAKNFIGNFVGWFFNKFHWTLISGAAAAILAVVETYFHGASFATINMIGIFASIAAGYIGDSAFNQGSVAAQ